MSREVLNRVSIDEYGNSYSGNDPIPGWNTDLDKDNAHKSRLPRKLGALTLAAVMAAGAVHFGGKTAYDYFMDSSTSKTVATGVGEVSYGGGPQQAVCDAVDEIAKINEIQRSEIAGCSDAGLSASRDLNRITGNHIVQPGQEFEVEILKKTPRSMLDYGPFHGYFVKAAPIID